MKRLSPIYVCACISAPCLFVAACALSARVIRDSAVHPLVDVEGGYLLGASQNGKWIKPAQAARSLRGGESYRVYGMRRGLASARGTKPASQGAPCDKTLFLKVAPARKDGGLALGASWNALPRVARPQSTTQKAYVSAVESHLKQKGIARPRVRIAQLWRVDLEGDGVQEVLVSATTHGGRGARLGDLRPSSIAGDFSVLLLRKMVGGKLQTIVLESEYYPKSKSFSRPYIYTLAGVLDANGDGRLEIVTRADYYEGGYTGVFEVRGAKASKVLEEGCGA